MLPLVGQKVGSQMPETASTLMAACIIVAQLAMIPVALLASRAAPYGRRPVFLVGFAVLPIRGLLYTLTDSPTWLISNQILDGIGAGIFGVAALLVMADLTRGTGRFNFAQGIVATAIGLGAAASNFLTGLIVDRAGYNSGFYFLSSIAVVALGLFALTVPETVTD
jgi:MFS family permease